MKLGSDNPARQVITPWYSARPAVSLAVLAAQFIIGGFITIVSVAYHAVRVGFYSNSGSPQSSWFAVGAVALLGMVWIESGRLLWIRRKKGAYLALGSLAAVAIHWLIGGQPTVVDMVLMAIALSLIAASWRQLDR